MLGFIGMPGPLELVIIAFIVLVIFGKGRLPELGSGLGKGISNFKRALTGKEEIDVTPTASKTQRAEVNESNSKKKAETEKLPES